MKIEAATSDDVVKRLRRVEGQIGGVIRMLEEGRDCADVVTQLAAANRALHRAGFKLVSGGMRQCLSGGNSKNKLSAEQMEKLFLSLA